MEAGTTGLLMIGGGVPKNFAQDTVVCAEVLGHEVDMHKYAIQITVADVRDGACSSSTLKEACSWGKVDIAHEQMVYAEATSVLPLLASDAYHRGHWKKRKAARLHQAVRVIAGAAIARTPAKYAGPLSRAALRACGVAPGPSLAPTHKRKPVAASDRAEALADRGPAARAYAAT